ncbi:hypothetical protein BD560DRAFT_447566 [Blakeslea trispora]|nr:hypothetical protein BD560DRAFT_447566 [Blakeslea trispora]
MLLTEANVEALVHAKEDSKLNTIKAYLEDQRKQQPYYQSPNQPRSRPASVSVSDIQSMAFTTSISEIIRRKQIKHPTPPKLGLFNKGKSSAHGKPVPDLVFSEDRFLKKPSSVSKYFRKPHTPSTHLSLPKQTTHATQTPWSTLPESVISSQENPILQLPSYPSVKSLKIESPYLEEPILDSASEESSLYQYVQSPLLKRHRSPPESVGLDWQLDTSSVLQDDLSMLHHANDFWTTLKR